MAPSGQDTTRASSRVAANDNDLFKKAAKAASDLRTNKVTAITDTAKDNIAAIIDELIKKAKRTATTNATNTTTAETETAKKTSAEAGTQTDEPTITVNQSDVQAIDKKQDLIINLLQRDKTYAEAISGTRPVATQQRQQTSPMATERINKARKELSQYEISLTTSEAAKDIQERIQSAAHKNIMKALQEAIDEAKLEGNPQLEAVTKLGRGIVRMRVITKDGAKTIREANNINWNTAYAGIQIYKPRYGFVIHGVPVQAINLEPGYENSKEYENTIDEWQKENANRNNVTITCIKALTRRKPRTENIRKKHQSIIVFTDDTEAADRCIGNSFIIESQSLAAEKYAPHLQLKQCYKCHKFGHTAYNCIKKAQCGKCSHDHPTAECTTDDRRCINCGGDHEAWHIKCPERSIAGEKAQDERERQSPFFLQ
jgi:hypothetical protein